MVLPFLGILLDTQQMEERLPQEKFLRLQSTITEWVGRKNATKREILSLVGQLQHTCKVVRYGRTFVARMYCASSKVKELDFCTRLNKAFKSDLCWWHTFLKDWNGVSLFKLANKDTPADVTTQTDAYGSWGCGAFFNNKWLLWEWPEEWKPVNIKAKEMAPIILSCEVWGPQLSKSRVKFECDNTSVVTAIRKGSARDDTSMHLLRCLWYFVAHYDIDITNVHVAGVTNCTADHLSRHHMSLFFSLNPQADIAPTTLSAALKDIVASPNLDWTSAAFRQLFSIITGKV